MRIALAEIAQETDSFSPLRTDRRDFETYGLFHGEAILETMRGVGPLGGMLEVCEQQPEPPTLIPLIRAWASAGGIILQETLQEFTGELLDGLRGAGDLDAIFLSLHGAASAEHEDDVEGALLRAVRAEVGRETPIVVALDHHANITAEMVRHADLLVGHETQPHDPPATGRKAARLMFRLLQKQISPARAWRKIPLITQQDQFLTAGGPMKEWFDRARKWEQQPGVLDVSPYPMQPWLDVLEGGWAVVAHTDNAPDLAEQIAREMADLAWSLRAEFWRSERVAISEAVHQARAAARGLIVLSDTGDSVYGGAPGDNTCALQELVAQCNDPDGPHALAPVIDPQAVEQLHAAGMGASVSLELGGKLDAKFCRPLPVRGRVAGLSRGVNVDLADRGPCDLRRTALLQVGGVRIACLDHRSFAINHPVLYEHLGAAVADAKMVLVKTASNFQFFQRWRSGLIRLDSPGMTQSDLGRFDWRRLPRPIYPLDRLPSWSAPARQPDAACE